MIDQSISRNAKSLEIYYAIKSICIYNGWDFIMNTHHPINNGYVLTDKYECSISISINSIGTIFRESYTSNVAEYSEDSCLQFAIKSIVEFAIHKMNWDVLNIKSIIP